MNYLNHRCDHCGKKFTEDDDVVVCPICGTPQHRECYEENNRCIHEEKHSENYEWSAEENNNDGSVLICDRCGTENSADSFFCKHCSQPLTEFARRNRQHYSTVSDGEPQNDEDDEDGNEEFENLIKNSKIPFKFDFANLTDKDEIADNVTLADAKQYVQKNTFFYSVIFRNLRMLNRSRFNFAACLFGGGWFIYRKQYRLGIVLTLIMGICLCGYILTMPTSVSIYNQIYSSGVSSDAEFYNVLMTDYADRMLYFIAPSVFKVIQYAVMFISGLTANRCYYNHVVRKVRQIKEQYHTKEEIAQHLQKSGGVDTLMGYILFIGYVILNILPSFMSSLK